MPAADARRIDRLQLVWSPGSFSEVRSTSAAKEPPLRGAKRRSNPDFFRILWIASPGVHSRCPLAHNDGAYFGK
jgi:hypothetical protein